MKNIGIKIIICFILLVSCSEEQIDDNGKGIVKKMMVQNKIVEKKKLEKLFSNS